jgi:hypothetical protein
MGKHVVLADVDLGTASLPPDAGIMHPKPGAASVAGQERPAQGRRRNLRTRKSVWACVRTVPMEDGISNIYGLSPTPRLSS